MKTENTAPTAAVIVNHATTRGLAADNRLFVPANKNEIHVFNSAQRTITYKALHQLGHPATIDQIAAVADTLGLKSKTPTTASVRYHLNLLIKDGFVVVSK